MACGLPTIASDIPVLREIAGDAVLYFDQNDKREIANAMIRIVKDEDLRHELRVKGLAQSAKFSWLKCASETLKEMENL